MSRENVELVRSAFDAFERGDVDGMLERMADDVVTHRVDPDDAVYHGREGFLQATSDWIEGFEDWAVTPEEFLDAGEIVVVRVHQTARGTTSGATVENQMWFVFDLRGERVARLTFHLRETEALEAAGLTE